MLHFRDLNINDPSLTVMYSRSNMQSLYLSLWIPSARLSARLDSELDIDFTLSVNFSFVCYCLAIFIFFFAWHQKGNVLLRVSPRHSIFPSNSSAKTMKKHLHILAQFPFTISQRKLDYYHQMLNIPLTSWFPKQLKT